MPTFWQWWFIMGAVFVLEAICTKSFRQDVQATVIPEQLNKGYSQRTIYTFATIACAIAVVFWPFILVRSWFK